MSGYDGLSRAQGEAMRRRGTTGAKVSKTPRRNAQQVVCSSQADGQEAEVARLTRELREALEQQKASAEILSVISSSVADTQPVFEKILASCKHLFGGDELSVLLVDEQDQLIIAAYLGDYYDVVSPTFPTPVERAPIGRAIRERRVLHWPDVINGDDVPGVVRKTAEIIGYRSMVFAPMLWEDRGIGAIGVARSIGPFKPKELAILQTFAAQAVIAIENTRLLNELRQRTDDLSESLEQQTATSDVLQAISSSTGDLNPVFKSILQNATRICEAKFGVLVLTEGQKFRMAAMHGVPAAFVEKRTREPVFMPGPNNNLALATQTRKTQHVADLRLHRSYAEREPAAVALADAAGARTLVVVPMLKDNSPIGAIAIYRTEVRPFTDKQVELVTNFAAQAVIAIENARLLNELRESLQRQTATADVLKVISRSTFDLQTVLDTLLSSAIRLCGAPRGMIFRYDGESCHAVAAQNLPPGYLELWERNPVRAGRGTTVGRALLECRPVQIVDVVTDPEYSFDEAQKIFTARTVLAVPLLREGVPQGVIGLIKTEVEPFTDQQIALVETFADQAAIAIENVRLFESVEARTRELAKSLDELRTTQDRLVQTQKLASLGQLTAGIAHEIKNPLNFVNNFSGISAELIDELQDTLKGPLDDKARSEIKDLADTLRSNLDKVVQHGKRADAIVKNMLQHSREGTGEHRPVDINALVEESLNLAWHGARAEKQGFEITFKHSFDPSAGQVDVFPQDIRRALLNLISNGFYAATKRMEATNGGDYEPVVVASTKNLGDRVEIRIRDNGTGISPDVKDKMFNPFFTTKPTGEGTGLGLSISHDIIVKQHAGSIEVDTLPDEFTEITVILPRAAVFV
jgi:two-component system, NtrC family, sensor kinase